ncbi:PREDICTED: COP9 signalosome complex subunit 8 isoform X2 [Dinoponera quadriceps]|uniref:COP9 signalosome complex subunit 8 n=1 Tax=Dinoponera quadriceps TaxID=609295 RepID=A0A6P3Y612_DINQU|nr:PREDICTED: COP9 signalosome complex subunit 8 isoform X2 [Dinoponera quadriceps]
MDLSQLINELERTELEVPDEVTCAQPYVQLLATYLFENDLCNAKYFWKRIPPNVKAANEELGRIWLVGQRMWQRDWAAVHVALNVEWSEDVMDIMTALKDKVRERMMKLISKAYSSLDLTVLASVTGLSLDEARRTAIDRGWSIDGVMVQPRKPDEDECNLSNEVCLTEDQLQKLTQFVSFLEN